METPILALELARMTGAGVEEIKEREGAFAIGHPEYEVVYDHGMGNFLITNGRETVYSGPDIHKAVLACTGRENMVAEPEKIGFALEPNSKKAVPVSKLERYLPDNRPVTTANFNAPRELRRFGDAKVMAARYRDRPDPYVYVELHVQSRRHTRLQLEDTRVAKNFAQSILDAVEFINSL